LGIRFYQLSGELMDDKPGHKDRKSDVPVVDVDQPSTRGISNETKPCERRMIWVNSGRGEFEHDPNVKISVGLRQDFLSKTEALRQFSLTQKKEAANFGRLFVWIEILGLPGT
jgi:hypothetical protein